MKQLSFLMMVVTLIAVALAGCGPTEDETTKTETTNLRSQPELSGADVLNGMFKAYADATSYTDKAVLYMTYRTEAGRPMQEPMPWSLQFQKSSQEFSGQFFDSVVKYDGQTLGCRVFDIESDNQDNQFLLLTADKLPLDQLLRDELACRFIGGFEEIPLRSDRLALIDALLPPTIKLLTGQSDFPWFTQPESVRRLDDQTIEGVVCFHVQSTFQQQTCDIWIEQETGLIHQLLFPNTIFTDDVANTNRIRDLKIVARFHNCQFNQTLPSDAFTVAPPMGASLVTEFVALPEAFPSELIGNRAPEFALKTTAGQTLSNSDFEGKPTTLLWIAGYGASEGINKFEELNRQFSNGANFGVLYSDAEMKDPAGSTFALSDTFRKTANIARLSVPFYCDHHLDVAALMQIKAIPSVVVLDENLKIQYARPLSGDDWAGEAKAAIERVIRGEDIAQEMIDEYGKFYSAYRAKLHSVAFDRKSISAKNASVQLAQRGRGNSLWAIDTLLQPGNMAALTMGTKGRIAVLDGYRTVVLLDENGKQLKRKELELPENQAVTQIRIAEFDGDILVAAFSKLGGQVYWFNENLELVNSYPKSRQENEKVTDCHFAKSNESLGLVVALQGRGIQQIDMATGDVRELSERSADEFSVAGNLFGGVINGQIFCSSLPDLNPNVFSGWHFSSIASCRNQPLPFCALGATDNSWQAIGLDSQFSIQWKAEVGEQEFGNDIEPLVGEASSGHWVIANSDYGFSVLNRNGKVLHMNRVDRLLSGISCLPVGGKLRVVYSEGSWVKCVELDVVN